jgi:hypothetical protein
VPEGETTASERYTARSLPAVIARSRIQTRCVPTPDVRRTAGALPSIGAEYTSKRESTSWSAT